MNKLTLLAALFVLCSSASVFAQRISPNALGLRVSDGESLKSLDLELSYQRRVMLTKRVEVDLGFRSFESAEVYKGVGLFEWVFQLNPAIHWYVGGGGGAELVVFDASDCTTSPFAAVILGLEYDLNLPFSISLDLRPEYFPSSSALDDLNFDLGLAIRYEF